MAIKTVSIQQYECLKLKEEIGFCQNRIKSLQDRIGQIRGKSKDLEFLQSEIQFQESHIQILQNRIDSHPYSLSKMVKTAQRAVAGHRKKEKSGVYLSVREAVPVSLALKKKAEPLSLTFDEAEAIGGRDAMEDAHFHEEIDQGSLAAVFDGHGGKEVAELAKKEFPRLFREALKTTTPYGALKQAVAELQKIISENQTLNGMGGCTAVICFIDKATNTIYTATLGDAEANIYRDIDGERKSIPLSLVLDWDDSKEEKRVEAHQPSTVKYWKERGVTGKRRSVGINVSRALGDCELGSVISHKPKISINVLKPGDIVTLACDGLKDYTEEQDIAQAAYQGAKALVKLSIEGQVQKELATQEKEVKATNEIIAANHPNQPLLVFNKAEREQQIRAWIKQQRPTKMAQFGDNVTVMTIKVKSVNKCSFKEIEEDLDKHGGKTDYSEQLAKDINRDFIVVVNGEEFECLIQPEEMAKRKAESENVVTRLAAALQAKNLKTDTIEWVLRFASQLGVDPALQKMAGNQMFQPATAAGEKRIIAITIADERLTIRGTAMIKLLDESDPRNPVFSEPTAIYYEYDIAAQMLRVSKKPITK